MFAVLGSFLILNAMDYLLEAVRQEASPAVQKKRQNGRGKKKMTTWTRAQKEKRKPCNGCKYLIQKGVLIDGRAAVRQPRMTTFCTKCAVAVTCAMRILVNDPDWRELTGMCDVHGCTTSAQRNQRSDGRRRCRAHWLSSENGESRITADPEQRMAFFMKEGVEVIRSLMTDG